MARNAEVIRQFSILRTLEASRLGDDDKAAILGGNAKKFYGIE